MLHHPSFAIALDAITVLAEASPEPKVPDPGSGSPPPGAGGFMKILRWAAWLSFGVCVLGVMFSGAMMALSHRRGEGGEHAARLGWVLAGSIVIGSASALVGALI